MEKSSAMSWKRLLPLTIAVASYLCLGALVFQFMEGEPEIERRKGLKEMIKHFIGMNVYLYLYLIIYFLNQ